MGIFKPPYGSRLNLGHPLAKGLVGCWVMNERSGPNIFDLSGNANHGNIVGDIIWNNKGLAVPASGDVYIACGNDASLQITGSMTVAFRVNSLDSLGKTGKHGDGDYGWLVAIMSSSDRVEFGTSSDGAAWQNDVTADGTAPPLVPLSIVCTYDGAYKHAYINGKAGGGTFPAAFPAGINNTAVDMWIGNVAAFPDPWGGTFEYYYIYNRALTPHEVQVLHINPYAMFEDPYPIELFGYVSEKLGYAFGEQNPTEETAESWATWSDGAAGSPTIVGDADWGQIKVQLNALGQSAVKDLGSVKNRIIVLTRDKYGSGSGNIKTYIRGQAATFNQDDGSPAWEEYAAPVKKDWRFIQTKIEYSV